MKIFFITLLSLSLVAPVFAQVPQAQIRSQNTIRVEQNTGNVFLQDIQESREKSQLQERLLRDIQSFVPSPVSSSTDFSVQSNTRVNGTDLSAGVREEVRATIRVQDVAPQVVQELRVKQRELRQNFEERRAEFQEALEEKKTELRAFVEQKKVEIQERVQTFVADERKQAIIVRVYDQVNALNERLTGNYTEILSKFDAVLGGVISRTDKAEAVGRDVSAVRSAVIEAQAALAAARALVAEQTGKSYSFEISSGETLRSDVGEARNRLQEDLGRVREKIREVQQAIRDAAVALAQLPNINEIEIGDEADTAPSDQAESVEAQ